MQSDSLAENYIYVHVYLYSQHIPDINNTLQMSCKSMHIRKIYQR